ncbi:LysR family transcriptional regulator [Agromyces sp. CFH 90414]|uniref:LysR family transcriptional regulator n=1 Tax=Agromyces agglutinans TaxID=2662258 RepID=A0A6I2FF92_9MICO|nr:LysR family transcriptional regulator [Agromyces agglutinans]MRG61226.1 LysR family transcriptional regulator [Agromyces agglutinans]
MAPHDLDHLRTFVTVTRAGSLTAAASLLGLSQPTVTAHIQALEASVGFALLVRTRAGVQTTAKGAALAREVAAHVDALEDAVFAVASRGSATAALHLGGPAELLSTMVLPHLAELADASGATLHVRFGLADDLLEALAGGSLDLVVSAVRPTRRGIAATPVYDEVFHIVAAPPWAGHPIDDVPVIAYGEELPIIRRYWRSVFDCRPEGLRVAAVVPDLREVAAAVRAGIGMSVLPEYLVRDDVDAGRLVRLHEPEVPPLNTVYLATRGRDAERDPVIAAAFAAVRRFIG